MEPSHANHNLTTASQPISDHPQLVNPLPRAVLRPNSYILLDGEWQFALDTDDQGLRERWYLGHTYERTAQWPGSVEDHLQQAHEHVQSTPWQDKVVVWYERDFVLPERDLNGTGVASLSFN